MILRTLVVALALCGIASAQEIRTSDAVTEMETSYQSAANKAAPAVVAIKVDREPETEKPKAPTIPGFRRGFGLQPPEEVFAKRPVAWCSGVVIEPNGTILTTYFNVSGKVKSSR
jgi:S1-C subfamily serine protease